MYKIYIFMQCAPDSYELYQSIFGLRADAEIGPERSDFDTSLSEAEIEYAAGVVRPVHVWRSKPVPAPNRSHFLKNCELLT